MICGCCSNFFAFSQLGTIYIFHLIEPSWNFVKMNFSIKYIKLNFFCFSGIYYRGTMTPLWFTIIGWFLAAVAVVGNGLVIFLITTKQRLHTTANWFILSLAVADFCVGLSFHTSHSACLSWFTCEKNEKTILKRMRWFFLDASIVSLCVLVVDRYIAISKPLKYLNVIKRKQVAVMISMAWVGSLVLNLLPFVWIFSGVDKETELLWNRIFLLTVLLLFEFLPCFLLATATVHMLLIVRKHHRQTAVLWSQLNFNQPEVGSIFPQNRQRRESSSAKVTSVVVAVFILCYILDIYLTFCYWFDACSPPGSFYFVDKLLLLTNSTLNPIAYSFFKKDIKAEMKKLCRL